MGEMFTFFKFNQSFSELKSFIAKEYLMWVMYWIVCDVKVIARKNHYEKYRINDFSICIEKKKRCLTSAEWYCFI